MKTAIILGICVFSSVLLATPVELSGTDAQTIYYDVNINNGGQPRAGQNGFYLTGGSYFTSLTLSNSTSLVFPTAPSGTLTSAELILSYTGATAPDWLPYSTTTGTPTMPAVTIGVPSVEFTVTAGLATYTHAGFSGVVDLMTVAGFDTELASGATVTVTWTATYGFTAGTPACTNCIGTFYSSPDFGGSAIASLEYFTEEEPPSEVPEPLTLFLAGGALIGIGFVSRRMRR